MKKSILINGWFNDKTGQGIAWGTEYRNKSYRNYFDVQEILFAEELPNGGGVIRVYRADFMWEEYDHRAKKRHKGSIPDLYMLRMGQMHSSDSDVEYGRLISDGTFTLMGSENGLADVVNRLQLAITNIN